METNAGVSNGALSALLIGILIAVIGSAFGPLTGFAMNLLVTSVGYLAALQAGVKSLTGGKDIPYFLVPY